MYPARVTIHQLLPAWDKAGACDQFAGKERDRNVTEAGRGLMFL